jgi:uncharacterized protein
MSDASERVRELSARFLKLQLWVVLATAIMPLDQLLAAAPDHIAYMIDLEQRGLLFASGPLLDEQQRFAGRGLTILRAGSRAEALELAQADPFVQRGLRTIELHEWQVNEGSFSVTVRYSDQTYRVG